MPIESLVLSAAQARVLGSLIEKEVTTPDYYPLSLNALMNACNQRSNREPVMDLDEEAVRQALHGLEDLRLAGRARGADSRVTKYEHWLGEAFNFSRAETALLCVLLLRGPQTPGELRGRTERMHRFEEISDVMTGLQKLMERELPAGGRAAAAGRFAGGTLCTFTERPRGFGGLGTAAGLRGESGRGGGAAQSRVRSSHYPTRIDCRGTAEGNRRAAPEN